MQLGARGLPLFPQTRLRTQKTHFGDQPERFAKSVKREPWGTRFRHEATMFLLRGTGAHLDPAADRGGELAQLLLVLVPGNGLAGAARAVSATGTPGKTACTEHGGWGAAAEARTEISRGFPCSPGAPCPGGRTASARGGRRASGWQPSYRWQTSPTPTAAPRCAAWRRRQTPCHRKTPRPSRGAWTARCSRHSPCGVSQQQAPPREGGASYLSPREARRSGRCRSTPGPPPSRGALALCVCGKLPARFAGGVGGIRRVRGRHVWAVRRTARAIKISDRGACAPPFPAARRAARSDRRGGRSPRIRF